MKLKKKLFFFLNLSHPELIRQTRDMDHEIGITQQKAN
jgi:hypothetical protein